MSDGGVSVQTAVGHCVSASVVIASAMGWITPLAAVISIIWFSIAIWEMKTTQDFIRQFRNRPPC